MTQGNGSAAMVQRGPTAVQSISGSFADPVKLGEVLKRAAKDYHLVAPAPSCGTLPEGCEVSLSSVLVDVANETYDVGMGKRGLAKSALERIALAAGVSWDPGRCRRLDDGRDPRYASFVAVGVVRAFDGQELWIQGHKEMDLRDGSPQVEALIAKARAKNRDPEPQIREMRLHILAHAESKAKLRAIRSLGVRSSYAPTELARPFVAARLTFTGVTSDPELRRAFALRRADAMLASSRSLFGAPPPSMALPAPVPAPALGARRELDEDEELPDDLGYEAPPPAPPSREPAPAAAAPTQVAATSSPVPAVAGSPFVIPGKGPDAGKPIAQASTEALRHALARVEGVIESGKVDDVARATAFVEAVRDELDGRAAPPGDAAE